jgi:signal transduction histidine kinase/AmiR/NasT family two-component response regulator
MDKKILIIDDHEEIRTAVAYLLENANNNYTVFTGRSADEGLELLKEEPDIQVIILDIIMPVKNGIQVLLNLQGKLENLRIIVLTGYSGKFGADEAKNLGVFFYLAKPPEEAPLIFAIESAFNDIRIKGLQKKSDIFRDIARLLIDFHDLQKVLDFIAEKSLGLLKGYACHIRTVEEETRSLILRSGRGPYMKIADTRREIGDYTSGKVAQIGRTIIIKKLQEEEHFKKLKEMYIEKSRADSDMIHYFKTAKSTIVVPIKSETKVIGIINMTSDKENYFGKSETETLENFADQVSIAITIAETQKKSIEDEKFSALGRIMGDLAHVIENEAAKIRFQVLEILSDFKENDSRKSVLQSILERAQYLIDTKRNLVSPLGKMHLDKIEVEKLDTEIKSLLDNTARELSGKQITYQVEIPASLAPVYGDIAKLSKVFDHLIRNSYEAIADRKGTIKISAAVGDDNEFLNILVADTGKGIKDRYMQKLFTSFFSTKQGGMGYGLWYCKQTMRQMKGDVFLLDSTKDKGATFCVKIPVYKK